MTRISPTAIAVNSRENAPRTKAVNSQEQERFTQGLAEDLVTLLCLSDKHGRMILGMIKPDMFENEIHRVIVTRASKYWREYDKPPGRAHTADLVADILEDRNNPRAPLMRQVLTGMITLDHEGINTDFVMDQLHQFVRFSALQHALMETVDQLETRRHHAIPDVEKIWTALLRETGGDDKQRLKVDRQVTAWELNNKEFPPLKFVVPGLIVEGLTIFAGKPKIGKSWFMLLVSNAVALGTNTLGDDIQCKKGDVLYCALEDNERRLQARMEKLRIERWSKRLTFRCDLLRLDQGGIEIIRNWLKAAKNPRLVIIDTFKRVKPMQSKHETQYDADYNSLQELHELAHQYHVAIVVVHHLRKMDADDPYDTVSGTLGLTGAADTVMILRRDTSGTVILYAQGRDVENFEKAMLFDKSNSHWRIVGDAAQTRLSRERARVTQAMQEIGKAAKPLEIAHHAEMKVANVSKLLAKMACDGLIHKHGYGKYGLEEPQQRG